VFEKLDGSLIIVFYHNGRWKTATKGSFKSSQAVWAAERLPKPDILIPGITYLFEAIYPENRIVVHYDYEGLVLLGCYRKDGTEAPYDNVDLSAMFLGVGSARKHDYSSISDLIAVTGTLGPNEEGFVIRFQSGLRLKLKGEEYCRIHRLISRVTPLAMWDAMKNGDDLNEIRKQLPEEFWHDFDTIIGLLSGKIKWVVSRVMNYCYPIAGLSDKEVGLSLDKAPEEIRSFIFPYRRNNGDLLSGRAREHIFRSIRPTGNFLEGYKPSSSMNKITEEA
jgi:RNA ligase